MKTEELYNKTTEELYDEIVETLSSGNFLTLNGKPINLSELSDYINAQQQEIERLNNIIKETSEDLHQVVKWCTENKHNEDTIERYLVVDYGTIVGKINEIRTKLDKGSDKE